MQDNRNPVSGTVFDNVSVERKGKKRKVVEGRCIAHTCRVIAVLYSIGQYRL